jgi:hypothetical protein
MQALAQPQLAPLPLKPNCLVWYAGDPCDEMIQQYHQAAEQRQQQELQLRATAPLEKQIAYQQKQIADQQNQIKTLQSKIESQTMEALRSQARNDSLLNGIGAGVGAALAFLVAIASFRRLARSATHSPSDQHRTGFPTASGL